MSIGMNRHTAVSKALRDIKMFEIVNENNAGELRPFLNALWVAGWETGREEINQHGNKIIGQYKEGKLIQTYKSRKEAAKKTGFSEHGIYLAMRRGTPTKQGWTWRYL